MLTARQHFDNYLADGRIEPLWLLPPDQDKTGQGTPFVIDGKPYYVFANNGEKFPQSRLLMMQDLLEENAKFGMDGKTMDKYMERQEWALAEAMLFLRSEPKLAAQQISDAMQIAKIIRSKRTTGSNLESVIQVSAIWIIAEGEDPGFQEGTVLTEKMKAFTSRTEYIDFFLRWGNDLLNALLGQSVRSFRNAIPQMVEAMQMEMEMIQTLPTSDSGESSATKEGQLAFWRSRMEILKNLNHYCEKQLTTSIS